MAADRSRIPAISTPDPPCRILIVDDHAWWRYRVRTLLLNDPRWEICGEAADGREAVMKAAELEPDLILLDIAIPEMNGLIAARRILDAHHRIKILFLSDYQSPTIIDAALRTGARGYLAKSDVMRLIEAMETIIDGRVFISDGLPDKGLE
jgi:DNA-binding NarL/FixJ family response regulator